MTVEKYDYDALSRRTRIIAGTVTNTFVYSGPHIVAEWSNNVLARSYAYGPVVDDVLSMTTYGAATNTFLYLKDNLGSVHALVNTNGAVVEQYKYTAWGEVTVLSSNGTMLAASAYGNRYTWMGREYSWVTKLHFFRSRYYEGSIGRWLSKDKIGISGGHNLYEAFGSNPIVNIDPFGTITWEGGQATKLRDAYMMTKHGAAKVAVIEALEKAQGTTIKVVIGADNSFNRVSTVTVTGKSSTYRSGTDMNAVASPIEVLNHELDHAEMRLKHTFNEYVKMLSTPNKFLENAIEASAILDSNKLGTEIGNLKPRTHYWKERKEWRKGSGIWVRSDDYFGGNNDCN